MATPALEVNRELRIDPAHSGVAGVATVAPVAGRGLVHAQWAATDPLFAVVLGLFSGVVPADLAAAAEARLVAAGLLVVRVLAPRVVGFEPHGAAPLGWHACARPDAVLPDALAPGALAWHRDPRSGGALPFAAGAGPASLAPGLDDAAIAGLAAVMAERGAVHLPTLFPSPHAPAMARYFDALRVSGALGFDAGTRRLTTHDEALAGFWHAALTPLVARVVGASIAPSFSYFAGYLGDGVLPRHTDRDACTWTLSWLLHEDRGPDAAAGAWPLWVRGRDGVARAIALEEGEAALMCGHELEHWRDPLAELGAGRAASLLIFCWVSR